MMELINKHLNTIMLFTFLVFIGLGITFVVFYNKYTKQMMQGLDGGKFTIVGKKRNQMLYLSIASFSIAGICGVFGLYKYFYSSDSRKKISEMILNEKEQSRFFTFCDKLFSTDSDKVVGQQYTDMKSRAFSSGRSDKIGEVKNMCGNYAKSILQQK